MIKLNLKLLYRKLVWVKDFFPHLYFHISPRFYYIIHKGELLGYMGSTGYSKVEGTSGKFQTHLHFGMYITDNSGNEVSINPYWILKSNQNKTLIYGY